MKHVFFLFFVLSMVSCQISSEESDKTAIINIMKSQETAWSNHDLEGFMSGYWRSDALKFYGSSGLTSGWEQTLENYKKAYPTKDHTGTLKFKVNAITKISTTAYYVMGEYHLQRPVGNANGVFMIIFEKINGAWKIVADMSC
ncbi:MAG: DUF4440 domain-containing protein [Flavobacteriaceae bacterium]|nr:DUF4440 domain-containing protein [Flavobacteriaceae bacterium]